MQPSLRSLLSRRDQELERHVRATLEGVKNVQVAGTEQGQKDLLDLYRELLRAKDQEIQAYQESLKQKDEEIASLRATLEDAKGRCQKLEAQIKQSFETSSIPSSQTTNRKKVTNSRERSGRKPGGQPGHKGHKRKEQTPTQVVDLEVPDEWKNSRLYTPTSKVKVRQRVELRIHLDVTEYRAPVYKNLQTGEFVYPVFPEGVKDDVNYGDSITGLAFVLNQICHVSIDKTCQFISDITEGKLRLSKGMVNGLASRFAALTGTERQACYRALHNSPVMHVDFTTARVNGKLCHVLICGNDKQALLAARESKGFKGLMHSPVEGYKGILIHDHDKTFYNYGRQHQECLAHVLRYLKDGELNERHLGWHREMAQLFRRCIAHVNRLPEGESVKSEWLEELEKQYDEIIRRGKKEYETRMHNRHYGKAKNLLARLVKYKEAHLLFLHNRAVAPTNNRAERLARCIKRKLRQCDGFRSMKNLDDYCSCLSYIENLRTRDIHIYQHIVGVFSLQHTAKASCQ